MHFLPGYFVKMKLHCWGGDKGVWSFSSLVHSAHGRQRIHSAALIPLRCQIECWNIGRMYSTNIMYCYNIH